LLAAFCIDSLKCEFVSLLLSSDVPPNEVLTLALTNPMPPLASAATFQLKELAASATISLESLVESVDSVVVSVSVSVSRVMVRFYRRTILVVTRSV
jgi:hypothetical protein